MTQHTLDLPPVAVSFDGVDGNALALLGHWRVAAREQGWAEADIEAVSQEAMAGNYEHLLRTLFGHSTSPDGDDDE